MPGKSFIYSFADCEVHEREFSLVKAGETVTVEPKAFRVLLMLLRNPKKLIPKEELLTAVWGDAAVTENSLTRAIALLRKVLGDDAREPRFIETVTTVGYRWLSSVQQVEDLATHSGFSGAGSHDGSRNETRAVGSAPDILADSTGHGREMEDETQAPARRGRSRWIGVTVIGLLAVLLAGFAAVYFRPVAPDRPRLRAQIITPEMEWAITQISPDGQNLAFAHC